MSNEYAEFSTSDGEHTGTNAEAFNNTITSLPKQDPTISVSIPGLDNLPQSLDYKGNFGGNESVLRDKDNLQEPDRGSMPDRINKMGSYHVDHAKLRAAEELYHQVLQGQEEALGLDHLSTLSTVNNLGNLYAEHGKVYEAETMYLRALKSYENVQGPWHPLTLDIVNNLGILDAKQGKVDEAEIMYLRALQGYIKALGLEHSSTLSAINNLGILYAEQGKLDKAEIMYLRVLQGSEKALGLEHLSTLSTVNNLGNLYIEQGKLDKAETMCLRALQGSEKALGLEHLSTLSTVNNLGILYAEQGKLDKAETMYLRALKGYEKALVPEHLSVLNTKYNLGNLHVYQGKLLEAEKLYRQVIQGYDRALGSELTSKLHVMHNLGLLFKRQGRLEDAAVIQLEVLSKQQNVLGRNHPSVLTLMSNLASTLRGQGKLDEAIAIQEQVLSERRRTLGEKHPDTISSMNDLAATFDDRRRREEAAAMQQKVLSERRQNARMPPMLHGQNPTTCAQWESVIWNLRKDRDFVPRSVIKTTLFQPRDIKAIIYCQCSDCRYHRNLIQDGRGKLDLEGYVENIIDKGLSFFALLVNSRKAVFVIPFARRGEFDKQVLGLLANGPSQFLKTTLKYIFEREGESSSALQLLRTLDSQIENDWTSFLRPVIDDVKYKNFPNRHALPTYRHQKIGEGVSAQVFMFEIYDGHNKVVPTKPNLKLVRKELKYLNYAEIDTLWSLKNKSGHPHIVKLLTSYKHNDTINLVFPFSDTNLRYFLRERSHGLGQSNFTNIFEASIWREVDGLIDALREIHNHEGQIGIHFDLKPDNILVNKIGPSFRFLIADFGLHIARTGEEGAGVRYARGDEAYTPPEKRDLGRSYDIWSLGCIKLEILVFTIWGFDGLPQKLDPQRDKEEKTFFQTTPEGSSLRPGVQNLLDSIKSIDEESDIPLKNLSQKNRDFVRNMAKLIEKMLRIDPLKRPSSPQILKEFRNLLPRTMASTDGEEGVQFGTLADLPMFRITNQQSPYGLPAEPSLSLEPEFRFNSPEDGEIELAPELLRTLRSIRARSKYRTNEEDEKVAIQIFERQVGKESHLRFVLPCLNEERTIDGNATRRSLVLVPAYAFRQKHNEHRSLAGIRLNRKDDPRHGLSYNLDGDLIELRHIHGILMNQNIVHSVMIKKLKLEEHRRSNPLKRLTRPSKRLELFTDPQTPVTVQLWQDTASLVRECRLVIYVEHKQIFVMKFNRDLGFQKEELNSKSDSLLPSYIQESATSAAFAVLRGDGEQQPAFSIDPKLFDTQCEKEIRHLESIQMWFDDINSRKIFLQKYRYLKQTWDDEMSRIGR